MRPIETATEPVEITGEAGELAALVELAAELHRSNDEAVQALDRAIASIAATRAQIDASADRSRIPSTQSEIGLPKSHEC